MSLTTQFEQDADALKIQDADLVGVAALAKRAKELEKELEDLEETVKERKAQFRKLTEESIPEVLENTVSVRFGRGEDELCSRLLNLLGESGYPAEQAEKIEPMTLKAWVKEQVERGNEFPTELFGAFIGQKATIKSA